MSAGGPAGKPPPGSRPSWERGKWSLKPDKPPAPLWRVALLHAVLWGAAIWFAFYWHPVPAGDARFWSPIDVWERGVPLDRKRQFNWFAVVAIAYLYPFIILFHVRLLMRRAKLKAGK